MPHIRIGKWRKNLALRVPRDILSEIGLKEGERVEINVHDGDIVIRCHASFLTI